jgi:hypothetical protein
MLKTVHDSTFRITNDDLTFNYQESLTEKLDSNLTDFDQNTLNEIVLWKVNRYADFEPTLMSLINSLKPEETVLNIDKTKLILRSLLKTNGVQLAMASTILRFRNPKVYQIIDQRVYRIIYINEELKLNTYLSEKNLNYQIELYLNYLTDLRKVCFELDIPFEKSDRILFMADRRINKEHKLKNY